MQKSSSDYHLKTRLAVCSVMRAIHLLISMQVTQVEITRDNVDPIQNTLISMLEVTLFLLQQYCQ
jgi:hypothetical protein